MAKRNKNKTPSSRTTTITIPRQQYDRLLSRPKQSTLRKDIAKPLKQRGNPYLHTLLNPFQVTGVKVPSLVAYPTSTFGIYQRRTDMFSAARSFWANCFMPSFQKWNTYFVETDGPPHWRDWFSAPNNMALQDLYHSYRPVSFGVRVTYAGDLATNRGNLAIALVPRNQNLNQYTSFEDVANLPGAYVGRASDGVEFVWKPQDVADTEFKLSGSGTLSSPSTEICPAVIVALEGLQDGAQVVYELFANFEAIPEARMTDLVSTSVSQLPVEMMQEATGLLSSITTLAQPVGDSLGQVFRRLVSDHGGAIAARLGNAAFNAAVHYTYNSLGVPRLRDSQRVITL